MAAGKLNLSIEQGADFRETYLWTDSAGTPVPMNGFSGLAHVRSDYDGDLLLTFTTANTTMVLHPTSGLITLAQTSLVTAELEFPDFVKARWDLLLWDAADFDIRLLEGRVRLRRAITQR